MIMIGTAVAGSLLFIYHYVDKPGYEDEIDRAVKELREETRKREHTQKISKLNNYSEKALGEIETLERKMQDIEIQPKPEAHYVVYNRVPKVINETYKYQWD